MRLARFALIDHGQHGPAQGFGTAKSFVVRSGADGRRD
jgi:hypothetical protein